MSQRITIDPVTRIEGHLRIDVEVDGGVVKDAWSSGTMWRGIEVILKGRDPREAWIFTQRICGVCTTVHAIASVRAVENALGLEIPLNAQYIRNLLITAHALGDHIVHFYQLSALDWVDVTSALKADPAKAASIAESLSPWPGNSRKQMEAVKNRVSEFVKGGQLGIFANGYWGHPAMKLPPEINLIAVSHYLQALDFQRKANQAVAILGGKTPHIQNLAVGGVANAINLDNPATLNMEKLYMVKDLLAEVTAFVQQVYLPDVCAIGAMYADWLKYGAGVTNYLAVPDLPLDTKGTKFDLPGGTIFDGKLETYKPISSFQDPYFRENVSESIARSYYDGEWQKHPWEEETVPNGGRVQPLGEVLVVEVPAVPGAPDAGGPPRPGPDRVRRRPRADDALGEPRAGDRLEGRGGEAGAVRPSLHPRQAPRAGGPLRGAGGAGDEAVGASGAEHREGRRLRVRRRRCSPVRGTDGGSVFTRLPAGRFRTGS